MPFEWMVYGGIAFILAVIGVQLTCILLSNRNIAMYNTLKKFIKKHKVITEFNCKKFTRKIAIWLKPSERKAVKAFCLSKPPYAVSYFRDKVTDKLLKNTSVPMFAGKLLTSYFVFWSVYNIFNGVNTQSFIVVAIMSAIPLVIMNYILVGINKILSAWNYQAGYNMDGLLLFKVMIGREKMPKTDCSKVVCDFKMPELKKTNNIFADSVQSYADGKPNKHYSKTMEKYLSQIPVEHIFEEKSSKEIKSAIDSLKKYNK